MFIFDLDCHRLDLQNLRVSYKSSSMKEVIEQVRNLKYDNSIVYLYGERGTEKSIILNMILERLNFPKLLYDIDGNIVYDRKDANVVFLITKPEIRDFSFLQQTNIKFRCAVFVSDRDYEVLAQEGSIDPVRLEVLKKAQKIYIPPLRERRQDIIPLANYFLSEISLYLNQPKKELSKDAKESMLSHPWYENSKELRYRLTKASILSKYKKISSKELFSEIDDSLSIRHFLEVKIGNLLSDFSQIENSNLYDTVIQEVEKALISLVLAETDNNQIKASRILGINRNTLSKKIRLYNLL